MDGTPALSTRELTKVYGEGETAVHALAGVSLEIERGEMAAIMGPSGSGKSTLLHLLGALDTPRLRLPVLQPAALAERRGERAPARADRGAA